MKKSIVITSIFEPTEAVKSFAELNDYELIVVGDKKSPKNWECKNATYLSIEKQEHLGFQLVKKLPFNHYSRKMLGYLYAIQNNSDYIIDTDDDNIPYPDWGFPPFIGEFESILKNQGFVNIYQLFSSKKVWPRGLPLNLINTDFNLANKVSLEGCNVGIWQGLADEDPDVDAIYRLTNDQPCYFKKREPIVLNTGTICPFNTQNTIIRKELFPLLYLPTEVSFRFTDILRGLVAQPIMWLFGYQLGFVNATVVQKRNPHDYMKDFFSELSMYEQCEKVPEIVNNSISKKNSLLNNLFQAYEALEKSKIVSKNELFTLEAWVMDVSGKT